MILAPKRENIFFPKDQVDLNIDYLASDEAITGLSIL